MSSFTVYKQTRVDGGIRTGVDLDGAECFQDYVPGAGEEDPAILWYLDVRGRGAGVPSDPDQLWQWLLDSEPAIQQACQRAAEQLSAGVDGDGWPFRLRFPNLMTDVDVEIVGSALRRVEGTEMGRFILEFASDWSPMLTRLASVSPAA